MKQKRLTITSIGAPDIGLAVEFALPLLLKFHDKKQRNAVRPVLQVIEGQIGHLDRCSAPGVAATGESQGLSNNR
ncbi:hypothetical protein SAMN05216404_106214 [Nitrosospira multiformis]|uniref:Uncharacterized protein n=1 Tax=Nitrosospira multiformis TaxID=1231 RepID=A0A1H8IWU8_9PROT|nr:hypothetical protein [Nitrosospira multiformis]SEN73064.1 hypothetical protein SAMN05216404_106214 [Nitrosospira multiformis]